MNKQINQFKDILSDDLDKYDLIEEHLYLNILVYDEDRGIRREVAKEGYAHEILKDDEDYNVRYYVANYTKDKHILKHLLNDKVTYVREMVNIRLKYLGYRYR